MLIPFFLGLHGLGWPLVLGELLDSLEASEELLIWESLLAPDPECKPN